MRTFLLLLGLVVAVPAQSHLFTIQGRAARHLHVWSVSDAGDVNRDGVPDFIVGAPFELTIGTRPGSAFVYSGRDARVLHELTGDAGQDQFGISVGGAGDVDGDGYDDLIVGAWGHDRNGRSSGQCKVFSGRNRRVLHVKFGAGRNDHFGGSVAGAGDVDGDGYADFIVGALLDDNNGPDSGSAKVFSGRSGRVLHVFNGDSPGDLFGYRVDGAGDVNKDGFDDVIVGAPLDANKGPASGMARVLSGKDGKILHSFDGDAPFDSMGASVGRAGDVDGDGFADVIAGATGDDNRGDASGSARVFSGRNGTILHSFDGARAGDLFGTSVRGAGDVNRDGFADLIIGAPLHDRNNPDTGSALVYCGKSGRLLHALFGDGKDDRLGSAVSGSGDLGGDGFADVLVGAGRADAGGVDAGLARVFSVRTLALASDVHRVSLASGGTQRLSLVSPSDPQELFLILGSLSGTKPGTRIGGVRLPLNVDAYTLQLLLAPNSLILPSLGVLDAKGKGTASIVIPSRMPGSLAGLLLDHAYLVIDPRKNTLDRASNAVPLTLGK